jgi:hypothetical protein
MVAGLTNGQWGWHTLAALTMGRLLSRPGEAGLTFESGGGFTVAS